MYSLKLKILESFLKWFQEIATFCDFTYIVISDIQSLIKTHDKGFSIISLITQSIKGKFDKICAIVNNLSSLSHYFGAICLQETWLHDVVIKFKHFLRYCPFVREIHRSPVNSTQKGQWRGALMFSLICAWINGWVNNREAGDLRRHRAHYDVIVMLMRRWHFTI